MQMKETFALRAPVQKDNNSMPEDKGSEQLFIARPTQTYTHTGECMLC